MQITTTTLEMTERPRFDKRDLPPELRFERTLAMTPEFGRFLYGLIGGPWHWTTRLNWTRDQWLEELAVPGTEYWMLHDGGVPVGFVQLQSQTVDGRTHAEIRYFGLAETGIGRGLGRTMLERAIDAAWSIHERFDGVPEVSRVWLHTCSLDGPAALGNYQKRGFVVCKVEHEEREVAPEPLGSWRAIGGNTNVENEKPVTKVQ